MASLVSGTRKKVFYSSSNVLVDDSKYSPLGYETKLFYTMNNYIVETPRERRGVSILFCDHFEGNKVVSAGGAF